MPTQEQGSPVTIVGVYAARLRSDPEVCEALLSWVFFLLHYHTVSPQNTIFLKGRMMWAFVTSTNN